LQCIGEREDEVVQKRFLIKKKEMKAATCKYARTILVFLSDLINFLSNEEKKRA